MAPKKNSSIQNMVNGLKYEKPNSIKRLKSFKKSYDELAKVLSGKKKDSK
jgi:hypothetical protein